MSVHVVRRAVGCPTGVPDARRAVGQRVNLEEFLEVDEFAGSLARIKATIGQNGYTRGVIPAVLKPAQSLDYYFIRPSVTYVPNDSTHIRNPISSAAVSGD